MGELQHSNERSITETRPTGCRLSLVFSVFLSSISLGNLIRFSLTSFKNKGIIFFVPYIICSFFICWPLLILEKGLSYLTKTGSTGTPTILGYRSHVLGIGPIVSLLLCCYYQFYIFLYPPFLHYILSDQSLVGQNAQKELTCFQQTTYDTCLSVGNCFYDDRHGCTAVRLKSTTFSLANSFLPFIRGQFYYTGFSVFWTCLRAIAGIFVACLGILLGRGFRVSYLMTIALLLIVYLTVFTLCALSNVFWSRLFDMVSSASLHDLASIDIWISALGQALFSLGLGQGFLVNFPLTSKGSTNIMVHSTVSIFSDLFISFSSFMIQYFLSDVSKIPYMNFVKDSPFSNLPLSFLLYTQPLHYFKGSFFTTVTFLLFVFFWFVSFGSLFRWFGTFVTAVYQSQLSADYRFHYWHIALPITICLSVPAIWICSSLNYRIVLFYDLINCSVILIFSVLSYVVLILWLSFNDRVYTRIGKTPVLIHTMTWFGAWAISGCLSVYLPTPWCILIGLIIASLGFTVALFLKSKGDTTSPVGCKRFIYLTIFNVENLRWMLNGRYCKNSYWQVPFLWTVLTKYVASAFLTFIFSLKTFYLIFKITDGFYYLDGSLENNLFGQIVPALVLLFFSILLILFPKTLDCLTPAKTLLFRDIVPTDMSSFVEQYYIFKKKDMSTITSLD